MGIGKTCIVKIFLSTLPLPAPCNFAVIWRGKEGSCWIQKSSWSVPSLKHTLYVFVPLRTCMCALLFHIITDPFGKPFLLFPFCNCNVIPFCYLYRDKMISINQCFNQTYPSFCSYSVCAGDACRGPVLWARPLLPHHSSSCDQDGDQ